MSGNICSTRPTTVTSGIHYVLDPRDEQQIVVQQQMIQQQLLQNEQQTKYPQMLNSAEVVVEQQQQQEVPLISEQKSKYLLLNQQQTTTEFHQNNDYSNYMNETQLLNQQPETEIFDEKKPNIEKERKRLNSTKQITNLAKRRREIKKAEHLERINNKGNF